MIGRCLALAALSFLPGTHSAARELAATPQNVHQRIAGLQSGDVLTLQPGTYPGGIWLKSLHGRREAPITIRGQGRKTVILAQARTNSIDLTDCQWLVIADLTFDGQGLAVDAIKAGKDSRLGCHHILIQNNLILNHGGSQQTVGVSTKSPCSDWTIRSNTIVGAGTGLYLGNSDGSEPFVRGLIEYNLVSEPMGYCLQIKHQGPRPDVAALPAEPSRTIVRYNWFLKNDRRSPDGDRPNVLLGGLPDEGPGALDRYEVYGNLLFHNPRESLIQATGRVSIHDNVLADVPGTAISIMPHSGKSPKQVLVYHNTFLQVGQALAISGMRADATTVAANLAVGEARGSQPWPTSNVRLSLSEAGRVLLAPVVQLGRMDLQPRQFIAANVPAEVLNAVRDDVDYQRDFWGNVRQRFEQAGAFVAATASRPLDAQPQWTKPARPGR